MKLYGSLTSPYVRKVRMALMEKKIACDMVVEGPADAAGNVVRLNPLRAIPVLERDDGEVYFDSIVICEYIDSLNDDSTSLPGQWRSALAGITLACPRSGHDGGDRGALCRTAQAGREAGPGRGHQARGADRGGMAFADERMPASGFIHGNTIGIADIALAAALGYVDLRYAHDWRGKLRKARHLVQAAERAVVVHRNPGTRAEEGK